MTRMRACRLLAFSCLPLLLGLMPSCKKFLSITPTGMVIPSTTVEYRALLTRAYSQWPQDLPKLIMRTDGVECVFAQSIDRDAFSDFYIWQDQARNASASYTDWQKYYFAIYTANYLLEVMQANGSPSMDDRQILGECYALRAYAHFVLASIYAPAYSTTTLSAPAVPISTSTQMGVYLKKSTLKEVYDQIKADIAHAREYMLVNAWAPDRNAGTQITVENAEYMYRFSKDALLALEQRVAAYTQDWEGVLRCWQELQARPYKLVDLNESSAELPCHYRSTENILALDQVFQSEFVPILRPSKLLLASYPEGDLRKARYFVEITPGDYRINRGQKIDHGQATYPTVDAYRCSFRLADALLLAAEANAQLDRLSEAKALLGQLAKCRVKPGALAAVTDAINALPDRPAVLAYLLQERLRELPMEGWRWFDLRRCGQPSLVHTFEGTDYNLAQGDSRYTLPIPPEAKAANSNL